MNLRPLYRPPEIIEATLCDVGNHWIPGGHNVYLLGKDWEGEEFWGCGPCLHRLKAMNPDKFDAIHARLDPESAPAYCHEVPA